MNLQDKFHGLPTEPPPLNRRVYKAFKAPFGYLWTFMWWVSLPWLQAGVVGFIAAFVVSLAAADHRGFAGGAASLFNDTLTVGLVWTFYLGFVVAIYKGIQGLR